MQETFTHNLEKVQGDATKIQEEVESNKGKSPSIEDEKEIERCALEKHIDIFETKDLKYKSIPIRQLVSVFERGIASPSTHHLRHSLEKEPIQYRTEIREREEEIDKERENSTKGMYEQLGNVFYPEGLLNVFKDFILNTKTVETYYQTPRVVSLYLNYFVNRLSSWEDKIKEDPDLKSLLQALEDDRKWLQDHYGELKDNERFPGLKSIFSNPDEYEKLRKLYLKEFWRVRSRLQPYELAGAGEVGMIINPKVKVLVSWDPDYPTEAIIKGSRIKPKDIIGIMVSSFFAEEIFVFPNKPFLEFLAGTYELPYFIEFLKERGHADKLTNEAMSVPHRERNYHANYNRNLDILTKEFIKEKFPFEEGKKIIFGLKKIAKDKKIPIYNKSTGELIWPKQIK